MLTMLLFFVLSACKLCHLATINQPEIVLHISEDARSADLNTETMKVLKPQAECILLIIPTKTSANFTVPFRITDNRLVVKEGIRLDCETTRQYDLTVYSECGQLQLSTRLLVLITDVNEHRPYFSQQTYETTYVEGAETGFILKVTAYDKDCSNDHHACGYKIKQENMPFGIKADGMIWPTSPLNSLAVKRFIFEVIALDCVDQSESASAKVIVNVETACKPHFEVDPTSEFLERYPFRNLKLKMCDFCKPIDIVVRIGMDYDDPSQIKCDQSPCVEEGTPMNILPPLESNNSLPSKRMTYKFNGYDDYIGLDASKISFNPEQLLKIRFWMEHKLNSAIKTQMQILCESDEKNINRHHFSVYLHMNQLKMIKRHLPLPPPANHEFFPSLWSWNIESYMDGNWHFYEIQIQYPSINLWVDGQSKELFTTNVADEWLLEDLPHHSTPTSVTIGACWHGKSQKYSQHFRGDLAAMQFVRRRERGSNCYRNCSQRLELPYERSNDWDAALNENKSVAILRSSTTAGMKSLLTNIRYEKPAVPIPSSVRFNGTVVCENMPKIKISELWLRIHDGNLHEQNDAFKKKKTQDEEREENTGNSKENPGYMTAPGFVISGWFMVVTVTMASVLGMLSLAAYMTRKTTDHQPCPTAEMEWDDEDVNVINNPMKQALAPYRL